MSKPFPSIHLAGKVILTSTAQDLVPCDLAPTSTPTHLASIATTELGKMSIVGMMRDLSPGEVIDEPVVPTEDPEWRFNLNLKMCAHALCLSFNY